jgi:hypothetical protein
MSKTTRFLGENMKNRLFVLSLAIAAFLMAGTAAKADPLSIVFNSPSQLTLPGNTLTFDVTVYNTDPANTIFLNSDSYNIDAPLTLDDGSSTFTTGFWAFAPLSLAPSSSSGDFELFTLTIPYGTPYGLYTGSFEILGGDTNSDQNVVGTADFDAYVTPEPSSLSLLGIGLFTGLLVLGGSLRRPLIG